MITFYIRELTVQVKTLLHFKTSYNDYNIKLFDFFELITTFNQFDFEKRSNKRNKSKGVFKYLAEYNSILRSCTEFIVGDV